MRKRIFSDILKKRLNLAWQCIPKNIQKKLNSFIRYVDETTELEGTFIYVADKSHGAIEAVEGPLNSGSGYTFFFSNDDREFCDVILPTSPLVTYSDGEAIAIILHELSHAHEYYLHRKEAIQAIVYNAEVKAWINALEWASKSSLNLNIVEEIRSYIKLAISHETNNAIMDLLKLSEELQKGTD